MAVLVLGAGGLVGDALMRAGADVGLDRAALDITDPVAVGRALDELGPTWVINAAAQANVDRAEREPEEAMRVNGRAPGVLAALCRERGVRCVHLSTDYVLDGPDQPGLRLDEAVLPAPRSVYARSKLAGEQAALEGGAVVVRLQWVYAPLRRGFFARTLAALRRGEEVTLVTDQVGCPTPATVVAETLLSLTRHPAPRPHDLYHLACEGEASAWRWIEAAAERLELPLRARPVTRAELGGAWRPARSCLDSARLCADLGLTLPDWEEALGVVLR